MNLSEQEIVAIVAGLVDAGTLTKQDAEIYVLREFGAGQEPPYRYHKLKSRMKLGGTLIAASLRRSRPLVAAAIHAEQQKPHVVLEIREGLSEEEADKLRADYRFTIKFGHKPKASTDQTEMQATSYMAEWEQTPKQQAMRLLEEVRKGDRAA